MAVDKMFVSRALLETVIKCSASKNHAFLIAFQSAAVSTMILFSVTTMTLRQPPIAYYTCSKITDRFAVEPITYAGGSDIVLPIGFII
jgi:hypothetical protein